MGAIPVLDLRLLSQADINAIAEASSSVAGESRRFDDILIPKIDRSVFNESAGSRRQTYSRLRLAPRKPPELSRTGSSPSPYTSGSTLGVGPSAGAPSIPPAADDDSRRLENGRIILFLRQLFSGNGIDVPTSAAVPLNEGAEDGRMESPLEQEDATLLKEDGMVPDLKVTGVEMVGPRANRGLFEEQLTRMTEGMVTEEQLLAFLGGLEGKWASSRKRRKIVNASNYGAALPKGWKLLLGLQRKHRNVRLYCRRYISPCGKQFTSYEEASSYLLSRTGFQEARHTNALESTSENSRNPQAFDFSCLETMDIRCPASTLSVSFDVGNPVKLECQHILRCKKCNITFADKDSEMQHLTAFHKRGRKKRRHGESMTDGVIIRDGAYECQFCHKLFAERRKYNGHVGIHVRYSDWGLDTSKPALTSPDAGQLNGTDLGSETSINRGDLSAGPVSVVDSSCPDGGVHVNGAAVDHSVKEVGDSGESNGDFVQTDDKERNFKSSGDGSSFSQEKCREIDQVTFIGAENIISLEKSLQNGINTGISGNIFLDVLDEQVPKKTPENIDVQNGISKMFHVSDPDTVTSESMVCTKSGNDEVVRSHNRIINELESDAKFGVAIQVVQDEIHLSEEIHETMASGGHHGDMDSLMGGSARGTLNQTSESMDNDFFMNNTSFKEHFCDEESTTCSRQAKVQMQRDMKSDKEDEGHVSFDEKSDGKDPRLKAIRGSK